MSLGPNDPDDRLDRAAEALRCSEVPDCPAPEVIERTLAALERAGGTAETPRSRGRRTMFVLLKVAAAVLVGGGLIYVGGLDPSATASVFEEAAQRVRAARTLSYRMTLTPPGRDEPVAMRVYFAEPGRMRTEQGDGIVVVFDQSKRRGLGLDPASKTATSIVLGEGEEPREHHDADLLESIRGLAEREGTPIGREEIDGVRASGFRVNQAGMEWAVWIDPARKLPVRMETTVGEGETRTRAVLTDFAIDPPLDEALFSLEPPEGYAVKAFELPSSSPEEDVADYLRFFADRSGGAFPRRLTDFNELLKLPRKGVGQDAADAEQQAARLAVALGRIVTFPQSLSGFGYRGEGVELGDAGAIIFWYPKPDSGEYRALFGDLHAEDVPADRLPKEEQP
jgi:outer membrane lipoprotein-sorting protein